MHTLLRRSLVVLLPLLAACSSGGGGGAGPQPGSDEWHEQQARQASTQAKADLRERLKNVDRCAPTQQQMADVF